MYDDKWQRGQQHEDFNRAARHEDKPRPEPRKQEAGKAAQANDNDWERGQKRPAFNRAAQHEKRRPHTRERPVSREELSRREAARPTPRKEAHYTPGGPAEQAVLERTATYNEARIRHIRERLKLRKQQAREAFGRGR